MQNKTKEDVLGQIVAPALGDNSGIDEEKLREPLYYDGSVVRCFCFDCGTSTELLQDGAEHLAKLSGAETPASWENFYFVSQGCVVCNKDYKNVILKEIK